MLSLQLPEGERGEVIGPRPEVTYRSKSDASISPIRSEFTAKPTEY